jgi:hypothetical protein
MNWVFVCCKSAERLKKNKKKELALTAKHTIVNGKKLCNSQRTLGKRFNFLDR